MTKRKFNPFPEVNCRYGAPMGRPDVGHNHWDTETPLIATACGGDGYYDKGGAYWGDSPSEGPVWAVHTADGSFVAYRRAYSANSALAQITAEYKED